jgi:predicted site-specific integrase-resolvase
MKKRFAKMEHDTVVADIEFELDQKRNVVQKNDLAILNIIAANKWKRPIYFTAPNTASELGFEQYMRRDGLTYRLVPVKNNTGINVDWMVDKLAKKFSFGSGNIRGVYFDEQNRLLLNSIRQAYGTAAAALADSKRKEEAKKMLDIADKNILEENLPYAMVSDNNRHNYFNMGFLEACYKAEYKELAEKISKALHKDLDQQMTYYEQLPERMKESMQQEIMGAQQIKQMLTSMEQHYKGSPIINPESLNPTIKMNGADTPPKNK